MTDLEDRLRHDLRIISERAQPGSIRPLRVPPARHPSRAVRWLAPVMAMAAVIGIITGVSLADRPTGNRRVSTGAPAGTPRYYVTVKAVIPGNVTATVRDSATGATLGSVLIAHVGPGENFPGDVTWITGAANDRIFAIGDPLGIDILRLAPDGHVMTLRHLPKEIPGLGAGVLSPDGTELALPTASPLSLPCSSVRCPTGGGLTVVSLATGATRTWLATPGRGPARVAGSGAAFIQLVNWPGNGHEVFFTYDGRYRLLNVAAPGSGLLADSRPIVSPVLPHGWSLGPLLMTPDGKAVIWGSLRLPLGKDGVTVGRVLESSARTGSLLRVLYTARAAHLPSPFIFCAAESLSPTGLHALIQCIGFGRLDGSHFTALPESRTVSPLGQEAAW